MKLGDYVRTKKGIIGKIKLIDNQTELEDLYLVKRKWYYKEDLIKSSPNIIDLIEVGDLVNGMKVTGIGGTYHGRKDKAIRCDYCVNKKTGKWTMIYDDEIKSIVTKEQFKSMEYKVKE